VSATPPGRQSSRPSPPTRWKGAVRVTVALALLGVVLWIVPWRDHLTWPSQLGPLPIPGRIHERAGELEFRFAEVERGIDRIVLVAGPDRNWRQAVISRDGGARETLPLGDTERAELEQQPEAGLLTAVARLARAPLALVEALLLYVVAAMISFQRWQVLLRAVHVEARFWRVQKLGFLGLFFSNIIPGMTGGDLVKAILVARDHPEQRPAAVLAVIVDRAIGLLGLALIASGVLWFQRGRFDEMAKWLNLILVVIVIGALVVLSRRLRRLLRLDRLLSALPFAELLKKLDRAALLYREARLQLAYSIAASLVVHGMILTAIGVIGRALGMQIAFLDYYALAPLALIAQSLPLTPGGVGVGEAAFVSFFKAAGVASAAALALSLSYRMVQLLVSLVGGLLLLSRHEPPVSRSEMAGGMGNGDGPPPPLAPKGATAAGAPR